MKKKSLISIAVTMGVGMLYFYLFLPPIHPQSFEFWIFVGILLFVFLLLNTEISSISTNQKFNDINLSSKIIMGRFGMILTSFYVSCLSNTYNYFRGW